jgi:hypothetical protein
MFCKCCYVICILHFEQFDRRSVPYHFKIDDAYLSVNSITQYMIRNPYNVQRMMILFVPYCFNCKVI